ncbi:hypothetical protein GCM10010346_62060 [Streptomyces chryseus]|uniref:Uncharacterized protein n=1 Tax=Streptomyces chryseus TaxID=68186 RepID=A0ABQ3E8Y0_9ACTN|nr:hypothetical protein GCM10010346_62060 [Streptomyces chryseus]
MGSSLRSPGARQQEKPQAEGHRQCGPDDHPDVIQGPCGPFLGEPPRQRIADRPARTETTSYRSSSMAAADSRATKAVGIRRADQKRRTSRPDFPLAALVPAPAPGRRRTELPFR